MVDEPGRIMRMLTTPSINAQTWKQALCQACMVLLTLYDYYTPGWGEGANVERWTCSKSFEIQVVSVLY
jgi:hypothetical protein